MKHVDFEMFLLEKIIFLSKGFHLVLQTVSRPKKTVKYFWFPIEQNSESICSIELKIFTQWIS